MADHTNRELRFKVNGSKFIILSVWTYGNVIFLFVVPGCVNANFVENV